MRIGMLIHGLFLQALQWEEIVWGTSDKPGSLPRAIDVIQRFGLENINHIVFGTGASEKNGLKEAAYTQEALRLNLSSFVGMFSEPRLYRLEALIRDAMLETAAKNTLEEIAAAAKHFEKFGCDTVIYVPTCASHGPRCYKTMQQARAKGLIPSWQMWLAADPATTFSGSKIEDVCVVEPPHRGDDPMLGAPVQLYEIIPLVFKLPPEERKKVLVAIKDILTA